MPNKMPYPKLFLLNFSFKSKYLYDNTIHPITAAVPKATIKNKLSAAPGVASVQIDLAKKEAEITSSHPITADKLQEALTNTGYTISELRNTIAL